MRERNPTKGLSFSSLLILKRPAKTWILFSVTYRSIQSLGSFFLQILGSRQFLHLHTTCTNKRRGKKKRLNHGRQNATIFLIKHLSHSNELINRMIKYWLILLPIRRNLKIFISSIVYKTHGQTSSKKTDHEIKEF